MLMDDIPLDTVRSSTGANRGMRLKGRVVEGCACRILLYSVDCFQRETTPAACGRDHLLPNNKARLSVFTPNCNSLHCVCASPSLFRECYIMCFICKRVGVFLLCLPTYRAFSAHLTIALSAFILRFFSPRDCTLARRL